MLIYEVNLEVDNEIIEEFRNWLKPHVAEMLKFNGFEYAEILDDVSVKFAAHNEKTTSTAITVHYHLSTEDDLRDYLLRHADQMRAPALRHFGAKFRAKRRVLKKVTTHKC